MRQYCLSKQKPCTNVSRDAEFLFHFKSTKTRRHMLSVFLSKIEAKFVSYCCKNILTLFPFMRSALRKYWLSMEVSFKGRQGNAAMQDEKQMSGQIRCAPHSFARRSWESKTQSLPKFFVFLHLLARKENKRRNLDFAQCKKKARSGLQETKAFCAVFCACCKLDRSLFLLFFSLSLQSESNCAVLDHPFCKQIACTVSPATETSDVQTLLQN